MPVSEQQILAKAFLIQNKFAYLRRQLKANICNAMLWRSEMQMSTCEYARVGHDAYAEYTTGLQESEADKQP